MRTANIFAITILFFLLTLAAGCGIKDQHVSLTYEKIAAAKGGSGELYIVKVVEKHNAVRKPSGTWMLGTVKGTDRDVVTGDSINDWFMLALMEELYTAGYNVKTVAELPDKVTKGIKPAVIKLSANQAADLLAITSKTDLKLSIEVWKDGKLAKTLNVEAGNEEKGVDRSAEPISNSLQKTLQNAMRNIVPDIITILEK